MESPTTNGGSAGSTGSEPTSATTRRAISTTVTTVTTTKSTTTTPAGSPKDSMLPQKIIYLDAINKKKSITFIDVEFKDSLKVLFLGNSYTHYNDLPNKVKAMAAASGKNVNFDQVTPGGETFQGVSVTLISFDLSSKHFIFLQHKTKSLGKISSQVWDVVVVQEQSQRPSFPECNVWDVSGTHLKDLVSGKTFFCYMTSLQRRKCCDGVLFQRLERPVPTPVCRCL
jgi:hypothetical protein